MDGGARPGSSPEWAPGHHGDRGGAQKSRELTLMKPRCSGEVEAAGRAAGDEGGGGGASGCRGGEALVADLQNGRDGELCGGKGKLREEGWKLGARWNLRDLSSECQPERRKTMAAGRVPAWSWEIEEGEKISRGWGASRREALDKGLTGAARIAHRG